MSDEHLLYDLFMGKKKQEKKLTDQLKKDPKTKLSPQEVKAVEKVSKDRRHKTKGTQYRNN